MDERRKRIRTIALAVGAPLAAVAAMVAVWLAWRPGRGGGTSDSDGNAGDQDGNAGEHDGNAGDQGGDTGDSGGSGDSGTDSSGGCADDAVDSCADDACDSMSSSCDSTSCDTGGCDGGNASCSSTAAAAAIVLPLRLAGTVGGRGRFGRHLGRAAIGAYRRWISPRMKTRCRYTPSCSAYGLAVVESHGLAKGARLALARIRRCTPDVPRGTPDRPPPASADR